MIIDLSEVTFTYDFFSTPLPDGNTLILNKIDEDFMSENKETIIKGINIIVALADGSSNILCSSVIGTANDYFILDTNYEEYKGKIMTSDNMAYCFLETISNE